MKSYFKKVFHLYYDGFKSMTDGKTLWTIIIIKLFILFFVLKLFFFPNLLKKNYKTDEERSKHVLEQLTHKK
jgi:hypothetical protein